MNYYNINLKRNAIETRKKMAKLCTTNVKNYRMSDWIKRSAKKNLAEISIFWLFYVVKLGISNFYYINSAFDCFNFVLKQ